MKKSQTLKWIEKQMRKMKDLSHCGWKQRRAKSFSRKDCCLLLSRIISIPQPEANHHNQIQQKLQSKDSHVYSSTICIRAHSTCQVILVLTKMGEHYKNKNEKFNTIREIVEYISINSALKD